MTLPALLALAAAAAFAGAPAAPAASTVMRPPVLKDSPSPRSSEEQLRRMLATIRTDHTQAQREAILGGAADELRDAMVSQSGPAKKLLADRLPGMAADPFDVCRDVSKCPEAPLSMHVEDDALIDDAFVALARPWLNLQKARGKDVKVTVDPGQGVKLALDGLEKQPVVTLEASPAPTGGFDVSLAEGAQAAAVYASERALVIAPAPAPVAGAAKAQP